MTVAILAVFNLSVFLLMPGTKNPGLCMLFVILTLSPPTDHLIFRFADERRREQPVSPQQEAMIGFFSLLSAIGSIGALSVVLLRKPLGWLLSVETSVWFLVAFSVLLLLAFGLGYAARHSVLGRWGLRLAIGWLIFILLFVSFGTLFLRK